MSSVMSNMPVAQRALTLSHAPFVDAMSPWQRNTTRGGVLANEAWLAQG